MIITIPSKNRADKVKTLELIKNQIDTFLFIEQEDFKDYFKNYPLKPNLIDLPKSNQGITYARNQILDYFKEAECILMLDDDISEFCKRNGYTDSGYNKLEKMNLDEIEIMLKFLEMQFINNDITQLTISFTPSNWLKKDVKWQSPARVWCFNMINPKKLKDNGISYDPQADLMEDYDITAQILSKGLKVFSCFLFSFTPSDGGCGKNDGGCQTYRNAERSLNTVKYLTAKWGDKVKPIYHNDKMEVQFQWKKFTNK